MRRSFRIKGIECDPFEQDVQVTTTVVKDVPLAVGDIVVVQCTARVSAVFGEGGREVDLERFQPTKVMGVKRG